MTLCIMLRLTGSWLGRHASWVPHFLFFLNRRETLSTSTNVNVRSAALWLHADDHAFHCAKLLVTHWCSVCCHYPRGLSGHTTVYLSFRPQNWPQALSSDFRNARAASSFSSCMASPAQMFLVTHLSHNRTNALEKWDTGKAPISTFVRKARMPKQTKQNRRNNRGYTVNTSSSSGGSHGPASPPGFGDPGKAKIRTAMLCSDWALSQKSGPKKKQILQCRPQLVFEWRTPTSLCGVLFLLGITTEASWPCLRKKQKQRWSVSSVGTNSFWEPGSPALKVNGCSPSSTVFDSWKCLVPRLDALACFLCLAHVTHWTLTRNVCPPQRSAWSSSQVVTRFVFVAHDLLPVALLAVHITWMMFSRAPFGGVTGSLTQLQATSPPSCTPDEKVRHALRATIPTAWDGPGCPSHILPASVGYRQSATRVKPRTCHLPDVRFLFRSESIKNVSCDLFILKRSSCWKQSEPVTELGSSPCTSPCRTGLSCFQLTFGFHLSFALFPPSRASCSPAPASFPRPHFLMQDTCGRCANKKCGLQPGLFPQKEMFLQANSTTSSKSQSWQNCGAIPHDTNCCALALLTITKVQQTPHLFQLRSQVGKAPAIDICTVNYSIASESSVACCDSAPRPFPAQFTECAASTPHRPRKAQRRSGRPKDSERGLRRRELVIQFPALKFFRGRCSAHRCLLLLRSSIRKDSVRSSAHKRDPFDLSTLVLLITLFPSANCLGSILKTTSIFVRMSIQGVCSDSDIFRYPTEICWCARDKCQRHHF